MEDSAISELDSFSVQKQQFVQVLRFIVPPRSLVDISFALEISSVKPKQIVSLDHLVRELLDPARRARYDSIKDSDEAGGVSVLGLFSEARDDANLPEEYGLDAAAQAEIHDRVLKLQEQKNSYNYRSHVDNRKYDQGSSGRLCVSLVQLEVKAGELMDTKTLIAPRYTVRLEKDGSDGDEKAHPEPIAKVNRLYSTSVGPVMAVRAKFAARRVQSAG